MAKKKTTGRKNKYETHVKPNLDQIFHWKQNGWYEEDIFTALGISKATWTNYKKEYPELRKVIIEGDMAIGHVAEKSLFDKLKWQEVVEKKEYIKVEKDGSQTKRIEKITKQLPPDTTAIIFALKNKMPESYSDRRDVNMSGEVNVESRLSQLSDEELKELAKQFEED